MPRGLPDYSGEIWRAQTFKRLQLKENETLKVFARNFSTTASAYPWVTAGLASGATAHLIDPTTGLPTPYTVLAGYEFEVLMLWQSLTEYTRSAYDVDANLFAEFYPEPRSVYYESEVHEFTTKEVDPTFAAPHFIDFYGTNQGAMDMYGLVQIIGILRDHGTEHPTTKVVKCKYCGYREEVPLNTTRLECPDCSQITLFRYYPRGGIDQTEVK